MPFVPLIVAAVSIAASAGTIGAIIGGVALSSLSIGAIAGVVGAVGATIGAVGAVTGNKALKTAGLVIGGIGAIGGLANAVGAFGEGATVGSVFGQSGAAGEAAGGGDFIGSAASQAGGTTSWTGMTVPEGSAVDTAVNIANNSSGDYFDSSPWLSPTGAPAAGSAGASASSLAPAAADEGTTVGKVGTAAAKTVASVTPTESTAAAGAPTSSINPDTGAPWKLGEVYTNKDTGLSYAWNGTKLEQQSASGIMSFLKSPGGAAAVVGGLNMVSGMMDPTTASKIAELDSTAHANDATAALTNKRVANMNDVLPTARRVPVTGRLGAGMINSPLAAGAPGGVA